jgi:uncharacterized protein (TIGR04255 family)
MGTAEIPLVEVSLQLQFDPIEASQDRLAFVGQTLPPSESISVGENNLELRSSQGVSYTGLRDHWSTVLPIALDTLGVSTLQSVSLAYLNEIPLQDLRNFQNYLNISIEMPMALKDRIEFFRSEFTYQYEFGEIRVWLQPDWDEQIDAYCIQLTLESRNRETIDAEHLISLLDQMHSGLKDVFRQVLADHYIKQLPQ